MITNIIIRGQFSSSFKLRNAIITLDAIESQKLSSIVLTFKSKKDARQALSAAYQSFCREMPEEKNRMSGFKYSRGYSLSWDAARAEIVSR